MAELALSLATWWFAVGLGRELAGEMVEGERRGLCPAALVSVAEVEERRRELASLNMSWGYGGHCNTTQWEIWRVN